MRVRRSGRSSASRRAKQGDPLRVGVGAVNVEDFDLGATRGEGVGEDGTGFFRRATRSTRAPETSGSSSAKASATAREGRKSGRRPAAASACAVPGPMAASLHSASGAPVEAGFGERGAEGGEGVGGGEEDPVGRRGQSRVEALGRDGQGRDLGEGADEGFGAGGAEEFGEGTGLMTGARDEDAEAVQRAFLSPGEGVGKFDHLPDDEDGGGGEALGGDLWRGGREELE